MFIYGVDGPAIAAQETLPRSVLSIFIFYFSHLCHLYSSACVVNDSLRETCIVYIVFCTLVLLYNFSILNIYRFTNQLMLMNN